MSDNLNLDYSLHYSNWHTEKTREVDINYYLGYLSLHQIQPKSLNAKVLEIGCGMGNLMLALQRLGYHKLRGIDIDDVQIKACESHSLNVARANALDYLNGYQEEFDVIYMLDVLEHVDKPEQLAILHHAHRALKSNGMIVVTVPNAMTPLACYFENIDWTHYCSFSPTSLSFVLRNARFDHFQFRPSHLEPPEIAALKEPWRRLYKAEFGIESPILTPSFMAVCFKDANELRRYEQVAPNLLVREPAVEAAKVSLYTKTKHAVKGALLKTGLLRQS